MGQVDQSEIRSNRKCLFVLHPCGEHPVLTGQTLEEPLRVVHHDRAVIEMPDVEVIVDQNLNNDDVAVGAEAAVEPALVPGVVKPPNYASSGRRSKSAKSPAWVYY